MVKEKTRIFAASDLHGNTGLIKKLAEKAKKEKADMVILAGDLTRFEDTEDILGPFAKLKKPILLIPGNHESTATIDFMSEMYKPYAKNLHERPFKKGDLGIFGLGGADFGATAYSDKSFFEILSKAHKGIEDSKKTIMVTHMHPADSKAEFSGFEGNKGIRKAIEKFHPDIVLSGHIHEAEGIEEKVGKTKIFNIGRKGKIFEI